MDAVRKPIIKKLTIKTETLRELDRDALREAAGGLPVTGLCARTLQVPSCVPGCTVIP